MKCPYCSSTDSKVVDKRETDNDLVTRRRRECLKCSKRFTTYERVELVDLFVVKKDGRREPFDRQKLKSGLLKACEKRPVSQDKIEKTIDHIVATIRKKKNTEVASREIGNMVIRKLHGLDKVAYIRFASVYKDFADLDSFEQELKKLLKKRR
ncbi:MAG: transcriptional regulator NrdR [archaeon]